MTREEYQAKYGTAPAIPDTTSPTQNQTSTSLTPIKMTRAEYQAKYGQAPVIQSETQQAPKSSLLQKAASVADTLFGGGKVGEAIGTEKVRKDVTSGKYDSNIDYSKLSPNQIQRLKSKGIATSLAEERNQLLSTVTGPTNKEVIGSALQAAALFVPVGRVAKGITTGVRAAGLAKGASAIGKVAAGALAGEAFDIASNLQQNKEGADIFTPGLGTGIGAAIPGASVAKNAVVKFGESQAPRVINSLIKPLAKDFSYGKNPGRAVAEMKIVANNFEDLGTKIRESRQTIGQQIGELGRKLSTKPVVNIGDSLLPIDEAMKVAASQNNATLLSRLANVKKSITSILEPMVDDAGNIGIKEVGKRKMDGLTFQEARDVLGDIGDITQFTGNPSDDKVVNSALKKVYGGIKQATLNEADKIDPVAADKFRQLTERYADLSSAEIATKYRDKIVERSNLIGLNPTTAGIGMGLITAVASGGATLPSILVGITGAIVDKLAATPGFKTRLAAILSKKAPEEISNIFEKVPVLQRIFPKGSAVSPGDRVLEQINKTPNKQGGFISLKMFPNEAKKFLQKQPEIGLLKDMEEYINIVRTKKKPDYQDFEVDLIEQIEKMGTQLPKTRTGVADFFETVLREAEKKPSAKK